MAKLIRLSDGLGDSGVCVQAFRWNKDGTYNFTKDNRPVVGCSLMVGSSYVRNYSMHNCWLTTAVTEIIEEKTNEDGKLTYVRFNTKNSEYELIL